MAAKLMEISRNGLVLGLLPESEARELLAAGFLKPDDQFRADDSAKLRQLVELNQSQAPAAPDTSWFGKAKESLATAGTVVKDTAGEIASQARRLTQATQSKAVEIPERLLSGFIPQIRRIVSGLAETKPFQTLRSGVRDDEFMQKVFGAAYDCLPKPICRFVSESQFIAFCMKHRTQLIGDAAEHEPTMLPEA